LYNWYTVNTAKLAPAGWHTNTDAEWITLTTYLGGESSAGGKLKETGTKTRKMVIQSVASGIRMDLVLDRIMAEVL